MNSPTRETTFGPWEREVRAQTQTTDHPQLPPSSQGRSVGVLAARQAGVACLCQLDGYTATSPTEADQDPPALVLALPRHLPSNQPGTLFRLRSRWVF